MRRRRGLIPADCSLAEAIDRLPARDQKIVILRYVLGLTDGDVAEVLGLSTQRVWQRRQVAVRQLRRALRHRLRAPIEREARAA